MVEWFCLHRKSAEEESTINLLPSLSAFPTAPALSIFLHVSVKLEKYASSSGALETVLLVKDVLGGGPMEYLDVRQAYQLVPVRGSAEPKS